MPRRRAPERHRCFAVCPPGLEALCAAELQAVGGSPQPPGHGGVSFTATTRQLYAANLWSRTATRILLRLASFEARSFPELVAGLRQVPWDLLLAEGTPVEARAASTASTLFHTGAIEERTEEVLVAAGGVVARGGRPEDDDGPEEHDREAPDELPAQQVMVRVVHDRVVVSLDTSGDPLHRRGWRRNLGKAPLRPTLAAGLLLAVGWDGTTPLVDPLCGSGTIAVEAALLARGAPPGVGRPFGFTRWPAFEPGTWASVTGAARAAVRPHAGVPILASDRDPGAVAAATANAARAGVGADVAVTLAPVSALQVPEATPPGWVVTNPPYGERVGGPGDLRDLYAALGRTVRDRLPGWHLAVLAADPALAAHADGRLRERLRLTSGGIGVRLLAR